MPRLERYLSRMYCLIFLQAGAISAGLACTILAAFISASNVYATQVSCSTILTSEDEIFVDPIESSLKQLFDNGTLTINDLMAIRRGENPLANKRDIKSMTYSSVVNGVLANRQPRWQQKIESVIDSVRGEA